MRHLATKFTIEVSFKMAAGDSKKGNKMENYEIFSNIVKIGELMRRIGFDCALFRSLGGTFRLLKKCTSYWEDEVSV